MKMKVEVLVYQAREDLKGEGGHKGMWKLNLSKLIHNGFLFYLLFKFKSLFKQKLIHIRQCQNRSG